MNIKQIFTKYISFPIRYIFVSPMVKELKPFLQAEDQVLDLGCGCGVVAKLLSKKLSVKVIGIDIRDVRLFDFTFVLYDGKTLPFPGNYFDLVLIAYVLHHANDPVTVLKEARRVSKRYVVIYEDTPKNIIQRFFCFLHGLTFRLFLLNTFDFKFRSREEWLEIFREELGLKPILVATPRVFNLIYLVNRTYFVLEVK